MKLGPLDTNDVCLLCGHGMTYRIEPWYDYKDCGMPDVVLSDIKIYTCINCGEEETEIPHIMSLHRSIALTLCDKNIYSYRIKFLRKNMGWSSDRFAEIFGVDVATIRRWESGADRMPVECDLALRLYCIQGVRDEHYELDS